MNEEYGQEGGEQRRANDWHKSWYDIDFASLAMDSSGRDEYIGEFVLVDVDKIGVPVHAIEQTREQRQPYQAATKQWLLLTEHPSRLEAQFPDKWRNLSHPDGGIPQNVWVGLNLKRRELLAELAELRRIRARRLFFLSWGWGPALLDGATPDFEAWRCRSCGLRGEHPRPRDCPNMQLCDRGTIDPQIHWAIGELTGLEKYGIKIWSSYCQDRPE